MNVLLLAGVVLAVGGCADCDTSGCNLLQRGAAQKGSGIGGVIAQKSDVVENGCAECPFGEALVEVWATEGAVERDEAAVLTATNSLVTAVVATKRYHVALAPGSYVLRVTRQCVNVVVTAERTLTVNLKQRNGPTGFWMTGPGTSAMAETFGFDQ
jgi:hypothetical protein